MPHSAHTTQILLAAVNGDRSAADQLMPLVYDELRGLAEHFMAKERADHIIDNESIQNIDTHSCKVQALPVPEFVRGNCNGDPNNQIDLADVSMALWAVFPAPDFGGTVVPPCRDACDTDDDGFLGYGDAVAIIGHTFLSAGPLPPPFPTVGGDPTDDQLDCAGGENPCPNP